jgi:hypothetical protein
MHITSNTDISDAIHNLQMVEEKIHFSSLVPTEELVAILFAGSVVIESLISTSDKSMFFDDEISFIVGLHDRIGEEMRNIDSRPEEFDV